MYFHTSVPSADHRAEFSFASWPVRGISKGGRIWYGYLQCADVCDIARAGAGEKKGGTRCDRQNIPLNCMLIENYNGKLSKMN